MLHAPNITTSIGADPRGRLAVTGLVMTYLTPCCGALGGFDKDGGVICGACRKPADARHELAWLVNDTREWTKYRHELRECLHKDYGMSRRAAYTAAVASATQLRPVAEAVVDGYGLVA